MAWRHWQPVKLRFTFFLIQLLANGKLLRLNVLFNNHFKVWIDKKKTGKKIKKTRLMSINSSSSQKIEANFFDEDALFTFWFHLINSCFFVIGICRNNQGNTNKKKTEKIGINGANKPDISKGNTKKVEDIGRK